MQLVLATLQNRPIVYKMIRFDSATEPRNTVEVKNVASLADAETEAGADWAAGKAIGIRTRDLQIGDVLERHNGKIFIKTGETSGVLFDSSEYTGVLPAITVDVAVVNAIKYKPKDPKIQSIVDGELTWL
mgnify:CR=1 FL=1